MMPLLLSRAYSAGVWSALMRMRYVSAFLVRPGALGLPQSRKISGTSIKSFHEMKEDRDGKSAKTSATRNCLVQL